MAAGPVASDDVELRVVSAIHTGEKPKGRKEASHTRPGLFLADIAYVIA